MDFSLPQFLAMAHPKLPSASCSASCSSDAARLAELPQLAPSMAAVPLCLLELPCPRALPRPSARPPQLAPKLPAWISSRSSCSHGDFPSDSSLFAPLSLSLSLSSLCAAPWLGFCSTPLLPSNPVCVAFCRAPPSSELAVWPWWWHCCAFAPRLTHAPALLFTGFTLLHPLAMDVIVLQPRGRALLYPNIGSIPALVFVDLHSSHHGRPTSPMLLFRGHL
uniref:Uncharacterized protein n=1 Tax=Zea mays TaxID=4577 RepID=B4FDD2_MAIZE|nr:unknown [Zea mays]|eukprot:NP_001131627.1 uncharacterized protein LOC100192982 [Zea mays]